MSLNDRQPLKRNLLIGFVILTVSIVYSHYMVGYSIWPTHTGNWESAGGDSTVHYIGWFAYRQDNWHWPLTYTTRINYPLGTSAVFTDSIPVFAVLFKIFTSVLPENFQYFGMFIVLSYILQYGFGFLLIKYFSPKSWLIPLLGAGFFLISPIMNRRIADHQSLTAHWLILASIYLYCQALNPKYKKWILPSFCVLIVVSLGTHFYLASMVLGLAVTTFVQSWFVKKANLIETSKNIIISLIVFGSSLYFWGYFIGSNPSVGGEAWSLNLNGLINSQGTSRFIPTLKFIEPYQWEGYSYLGLGVLLLLPIGIALNYRSLNFRNWGRWLPLVMLVSLMALFALGNKIYFGETLIIQLPDFSIWRRVRHILHGTGRYIWPFYYTLLLWIFVSIAQIKSRSLIIGLLVAGLTIQIADLEPLRAEQSVNLLKTNHEKLVFPKKELEEIKKIKKETNSTYFWVLPATLCPNGVGYFDKSLIFAAIKSNSITNDVFTARSPKSAQECDRIKNIKKIEDLRNNSLYAMNKSLATSEFKEDIQKPENRNKCRALSKENWILCNREGLSKATITK
jgi:hypothetical protein